VHDHHHDGPEVQPAVLDRLGAQGLRMTGPRKALVEALVQRRQAFTAEDLQDAVPGVGRATVFRTIKLLVGSGLVCKLSHVDGRPLYSLSHSGHHHHALCQGCGAVLDIYRCGVDNLLENIELATGARVLGHRLEVFVLCPACVAAEPKP
jgi:Fe2+ or Zn2+ uptake regulation protein